MLSEKKFTDTYIYVCVCVCSCIMCVCVHACVHTCARAHVCVFDKKMIGTHAFTFYGKPAVDMLWTYLTVSLGT